jgi:hypothetical protein
LATATAASSTGRARASSAGATNCRCAGRSEIDDGYLNLLGLASHEYFHSWNVKRIKPAAFMPYDLTREGYTRQLWAFEGATSYYDDLALVRSGVIDDARYLELLGRAITQVLRTPGRHVQSVGDSSFDAWIKFYRQDENSPNVVVSYYAKGSLVAAALDLTLRKRGRATLDDVLRALWERYGRAGVGVPEGAIDAIVAEIAGDDMRDFFARFRAWHRRSAARRTARLVRRRLSRACGRQCSRSRRQALHGTATHVLARRQGREGPDAPERIHRFAGRACRTRRERRARGGRRRARVPPIRSTSSRRREAPASASACTHFVATS